MTWREYLKETYFISNRLEIKYQTVRSWIKRNKVPVMYFSKLSKTLASIGHELTPKQMRELNEQQTTKGDKT